MYRGFAAYPHFDALGLVGAVSIGLGGDMIRVPGRTPEALMTNLRWVIDGYCEWAEAEGLLPPPKEA